MNKVVYNAYNELMKYAECPGEYADKKVLGKEWSYLKKKEFYHADMLRVVLVGRVNAGKSYLANALLGKKMAPVKAKELTSWNAIFWPGANEYCVATDESDVSEMMSIEQYMEFVESKEKQEQFFKGKKCLDIFYESTELDFAIIDVPGFGTQKKENESKAMAAVREADVVLFVISADETLAGEDFALYEELEKRNKPIEMIVTQADCRSIEELQAMKEEIRHAFQWDKEIFTISSKGCLKGEEEARRDRKRIIEKVQTYQHVSEEVRTKNHASFELECVNRLKQLQEKVLFSLDKRFANRYKEITDLHEKAEKIRVQLKEELSDCAEKEYVAPYREKIIQKLISVPVSDCRPEVIINECIPEEYVCEYWRGEAERIQSKLEELWEAAITENGDLFRYVDVVKRKMLVGQDSTSAVNKELVGGIRTAALVGATVSIYQAVLGPYASYVTIAGAMATAGLPITLLGVGLSAVLVGLSNSGQKYLTQEAAEKILDEEIRKDIKLHTLWLLDVIHDNNMAHINEEIAKQEEKLLNSLPKGMETLDEAMDSLEQIGISLFNRRLELEEVLEACMETQENGTGSSSFADPVEHVMAEFLGQIDQRKAQQEIDTSNSIPFMPILFLSKENKVHVLSVFERMCTKYPAFKEKVKNTEYEYSYVYEDEICAIYFRNLQGYKKIEIEYIDVYERDETNVKLYEKKIREGSVLSDCQMRRKILNDISRATERVEILVPWMKRAIYAKSRLYKMTMYQALEKALSNGAMVIIGCGNSENCKKEDELLSNEIKIELEEQFRCFVENGKLQFYMRSFTHEKFLVIDNRSALCGSYNFLSNNGKFDEGKNNGKNRTYRNGSNLSSEEPEHPGESMKITDNVEGVQLILKRMREKYKK